MRGQSLTQDVKYGEEGRDGGVSKCTHEYLGFSECQIEKQVHKRKTAFTTAIIFHVWDDVFNFLEYIFIAGLHSHLSLLKLQKAPQRRIDSSPFYSVS